MLTGKVHSVQDHAENIAQEVFTSMWTKTTENSIQNFPARLYTVTRNPVFKVIQKQERFAPIPDLLYALKNSNEPADAAIIEKEFLRPKRKIYLFIHLKL